MINDTRLSLTHDIQNMAKIAEIAPYDVDVGRYIVQALQSRIDIEDDDILLSLVEQATHDLGADKASSPGNQDCHTTLHIEMSPLPGWYHTLTFPGVTTVSLGAHLPLVAFAEDVKCGDH